MEKRIDWAKADFVLRKMKNEGASLEKMASVIGCSTRSVTSRLAYLKEWGFITDEIVGEEANIETGQQGETLPADDETADKTELNDADEERHTDRLLESEREALRLQELNGWARKLEEENEALRRENHILKKEKSLADDQLAECRDMLEKRELKCMKEIRKTIELYDLRIKELTEEKNRYLRLVIKQAEGLVGL